jgi:two-component system, response regulator PdtaR
MNATPPPAAADPLSAIGVADTADLPNKISRCVDSSARVGQKSYHSSINEREDLPTKPIRGAGVSPYVSDTMGERISREASETSASTSQRQSDRQVSRGSPKEAMKPLRILVVEDDLMIGPLLAEMLEELGHVVCAVEVDAAAAVAAARRCHPDLMIVDVGLGEASGIAAVKEILKEGFVPHVFVTGDMLRGLSLGPDAVLIQKPYRGADLVAAIARAIGSRAS